MILTCTILIFSDRIWANSLLFFCCIVLTPNYISNGAICSLFIIWPTLHLISHLSSLQSKAVLISWLPNSQIWGFSPLFQAAAFAWNDSSLLSYIPPFLYSLARVPLEQLSLSYSLLSLNNLRTYCPHHSLGHSFVHC